LKLRFVTATRGSLDEFKARSPLVQSLQRVSQTRELQLDVSANNRAPLAHTFNAAIDKAQTDEVLVFIHDDVWIDDWYIALRLQEALEVFDVVGVAGNTRRQAQQEGWLIQPDTREKDLSHVSGGVSHGTPLTGQIAMFGTSPQPARLLDGVMLAAKAAVLQKAGVQFDPLFAFHFYDTDFCRSCEAKGLRLGTWPLALTHQSAGAWQSEDWNHAFQLYLTKWGD
jgi:GT2 family glycosyltransferase